MSAMTVPWFDQQAERQETHRAACRIIGHAINDWLSRYAQFEVKEAVPVDVRLELERMRDAMHAAGAIEAAVHPPVEEVV